MVNSREREFGKGAVLLRLLLMGALAMPLASPVMAQSSDIQETQLYQAVKAGDMNARNVRLLQRLLAIQGYNPGLIDGIFGKKTQEAIAAWQRDTGQRVHGLGLPLGAASDMPRRCTNVAHPASGRFARRSGGICR